MLGHAPNLYWKIMWVAVSPLLLISLLIYYIVNYILGGTPTYQAWNKDLVSRLVSMATRTSNPSKLCLHTFVLLTQQQENRKVQDQPKTRFHPQERSNMSSCWFHHIVYGEPQM